MDHRATSGAVTFLALLLLLLLYVGGYLVLAEPRRTSTGGLIASYRIADQLCTKLFAPLEWIDRKICPQRWLPVG
jgi:hypothetical protein